MIMKRQGYLLSFILLVCLVAACGGGSTTDITGIQWQWAQLVETEPASQSIVPNRENYTLAFDSGGQVSIQADCNQVGGTYTLDGDSITIALGPSTMAFCGEDSLDQQYLALLGGVGSYTVENDQLVLYLQANAGKMVFDSGGPTE